MCEQKHAHTKMHTSLFHIWVHSCKKNKTYIYIYTHVYMHMQVLKHCLNRCVCAYIIYIYRYMCVGWCLYKYTLNKSSRVRAPKMAPSKFAMPGIYTKLLPLQDLVFSLSPAMVSWCSSCASAHLQCKAMWLPIACMSLSFACDLNLHAKPFPPVSSRFATKGTCQTMLATPVTKQTNCHQTWHHLPTHSGSPMCPTANGMWSCSHRPVQPS